MRLAVAHDISAMMEYQNISLQDAAAKVIHGKLTSMHGTGGIIGLTRSGEMSMTFNTEGMFRGFKQDGGPAETFIYKDPSP